MTTAVAATTPLTAAKQQLTTTPATAEVARRDADWEEQKAEASQVEATLFFITVAVVAVVVVVVIVIGRSVRRSV